MFPVSTGDVLNNAIWISMTAMLPVLLVAMLVRLVIGILQTATSIQEQTLIFIPKILAVMTALVLMGPWMFSRVEDFARLVFGQLDRFIK